MCIRLLPPRLLGNAAVAVLLCAMFTSARCAVPLLPSVRQVPDSGQLPFGSARRPGVNAIDIDHYGYVEEEYYLSGKAAARDANGAIVVTDAPYTTRILLRKPRRASKFSGTVIVTPFNWDRESAREWGFTKFFLLSHGDVFVGVSLVKYEIAGFPLQHGIKMLQTYDPKRYGALAVYDAKNDEQQEMPQSQDVLAQLAYLLKSNTAGSPLKGLKVRHVIAFSEGVSAHVVENYVAQGRHNDYRLPDGRALYDGYMLGAFTLLPAPPPDRRADSVFVVVQNEREIHRDIAAKLEMPEDSDNPKFRIYDFVGAPHLGAVLTDPVTGEYLQGNDVPEVSSAGPPPGHGAPPGEGGPAGHAGPPPTSASSPPRATNAICSSRNYSPVGLVFSALLYDMERWLDGGSAMPKATRVETAADGSGEMIDPRTGNAIGGLRPPWITVPAAAYLPGVVAGCGVFEPMDRYDAAKLNALYGSYAEYARRFESAKQQFVRNGYLLPEDISALFPPAKPADFSPR